MEKPFPSSEGPPKQHQTRVLVVVDILEPFPESEAGNSYILVAVDYFTRWVAAYPIQNLEGTTVAGQLVDEFFYRFSPPKWLHLDQGQQFESTVIVVCKLLGVTKLHATPYHPQCDCLVKHFNRTLLEMLAMAVQDHPTEWEGHLRRLLTTPVCIPPRDIHHYILCLATKLKWPLILCVVLQCLQLHHLQHVLTPCDVTWSWHTRKYVCSWVTSWAARKNSMTQPYSPWQAVQAWRDSLASYACDT